ncbi:hypothetical protein RIF23_10845 [Lipingzhangella sp. LS1_29]|uniref:Uncharacterized protein n=1 Tax=Lipingzhangella rawalii TaxID=2055835 RepID=A0ABU2H695_9ACTN|nr:hypothetical protein [Lipingzhangella rawalii]MDS1270798.1 hypothetical protein [Lipingzhangella rawalii]
MIPPNEVPSHSIDLHIDVLDSWSAPAEAMVAPTTICGAAPPEPTPVDSAHTDSVGHRNQGLVGAVA